MNFNSFNLPISADLIQAFSWTLIHSLWQGLVLAIAVGVVLLASKKSKPALRYNLLTGLMLLFVIANGATFYYEFNQSEGVKTQVNNLISLGKSTSTENVITLTTVQQQTGDWLHSLLDFCSSNALLIVMIWLVVFLAKSVRAVTGMIYINRLRHEGTFGAADHWQQKLQQLAHKLNISSGVMLMESEMVSVPAVIGFFKPLILVPVGFLTSIPYVQVEAILLHELAHIRRQDFLVNVFQSFAESIYFFNPAVIWLSRLIREEREHCCDDLAIAVMQSKTAFVNALVVFQEHKLIEQRQALAFAGKRNHLLDRIKRIIYNNNKQLNAMEKLFVTASVLTATVLLAAFSPELPKPPKAPKPPKFDVPAPPPLPPSPVAPHTLCDTVPAPAEPGSEVNTIHVTRDKKRYEITEVDGEVTELKINGKQIAKNKFGEYDNEIRSIIEEVNEERQEEEEHAEEMQSEAEDLNQEAADLQAEALELRKQATLMKLDAEKMKGQMELNREQMIAVKKEAELVRKQLSGQNNQNLNTDELRKSAAQLQKSAEKLRVEATVLKEQAEVSRLEAETIRQDHEKMMDNFLRDLESEGYGKDKKNLSFRITENEFIVNGQKLSDKVHSKFKSKYLKEKGTEIVYNWKEDNHTYTGSIHRK
ncbi:M56 family metallopeptidase [Dyadobacter sp. CY312]|uniref:M56 family metallopeptidase n=1 Tax=Dyadobacter sp. CY312 TaxID=2907303 RepID=UPI001F1ED914|nr:M56 family metallopeptidase [Dyadobacter sp. CY312]MCE7038788.1 M48 family metalloprotease [Dyadobacter sp. CY312]